MFNEKKIEFENLKNSDLELIEKLSKIYYLGCQLRVCSNGRDDIRILAIECFEYASKYDHLDSICFLGIMYIESNDDSELPKAKECYDNIINFKSDKPKEIQNFSFLKVKLNYKLDTMFYEEMISKDTPTEEEIEELSNRLNIYSRFNISFVPSGKVIEMLEYCSNHGNVKSAINLTKLYRFGGYSIQDLNKAAIYAKIAAEHDDKECLYWLGLLHYEGSYGIEKDLKKSYDLVERAALQNHSDALCQLGFYCEYGYGCEIDLVKSFEYAKKSAELGHSMGQSNLAECYELGTGTEKNTDLAIEWYTKSSEKGNERAIKRLRALKVKLRGPKKSSTKKKKEIYKVMNVELLKQKFDVIYNAYTNERHNINIQLMKVDTKQIESEYGKMPTSLKDMLTNFGAIYIDGRLDDSLDLDSYRIDCRFDDSALSVCRQHQEDLSDEDIYDLTKEDIDFMVEEDEKEGRYKALLKYGYPLTTYYEDFPIFLDVHSNSENPPVYHMDTEGGCDKLADSLEEYMNALLDNGCFMWFPDEDKLSKEHLKTLDLDFSDIKVDEPIYAEQNDTNRIALHFVDESSNKFWAVTWNDKTFTVTYGKKGSKGVSKTTISDTTEKDVNKQANAKMKKGYVIDENFDWNSII